MSCLIFKCTKNTPRIEEPKKISGVKKKVNDDRPITTIVMKDESVYTGTLEDGLLDGRGILKYKNGSIYEGEFVKGKKEGKGKWTDLDGNMYDGEWKDNKMEGNGIYKSSDNFIYEGEFKNGLKHGKGTVTTPDKTRYNCTYENDEQIGEAELFFSNGDHAKGYIKDGTLNGYGRYEFKNGDVYVGNFKDGLFHGDGYYKWNKDVSYKVFQGSYSNGKKKEGILKNTDGRILSGNYVDNELNGEVLEISPQGVKAKVLYNNGNFVKIIDQFQHKINVNEYFNEANIETTIFSNPNYYKTLYETEKRARARFKVNAQNPSDIKFMYGKK